MSALSIQPLYIGFATACKGKLMHLITYRDVHLSHWHIYTHTHTYESTHVYIILSFPNAHCGPCMIIHIHTSAILRTAPSLSCLCVSVIKQSKCLQEVHCSLCRAELQAAGRVHRDPASSTQHRQGLLEAGVWLRMHLHRHAERDRFGSGEIQAEVSLTFCMMWNVYLKSP